jgi:hypothetical protein
MFEDDRGGSGSPRVSGVRSLRARTARLATAGAAVLVLGPLALAAQASAATIAPTKGCYVNVNSAQGAPMTIVGNGFIPGDTVDISGTGVFATTIASPTGTIAVTTPAPILATINPASLNTALTAEDTNFTTGQTITASTVVKSANLAALPTPDSVKNLRKDKVKFTFSGFTPGKNIYGYYIRKKVVAKSKFGKATGACGQLTKRALLYPGGHPRFEQYTVAFESLSKYSKKANPLVVGKLNIFKF